MKTIFLILAFAAQASAAVPAWQVVSSTATGTSTAYLAGTMKVYPSTATASASPAITLNGPTATVTATSFAGTASTATNLSGGVAGQVPMQSAAGATTFTTPASANTANTLVKRDASGNFSAGTVSAVLAGNAATSSALAADPSDCTLPNVSLGINASGAAQCAQPSNVTGTASNITGNLAASQIASGSLGGSVVASSVALAGFYNNNSVRSNLGLTIGTNVQAWDADLDTLATLNGSGLVKISSVAVGAIYPQAVSAGTYSNITLPATNVAAGTLGASVIASSIAVNTVYDSAVNGTLSWAKVSKGGSNLNELATRSHSVLSDIGTNTHPQIDSHLAATSAHSATDSNTGGRIVSRDVSGNFSAGTITAARFSGPLTGAVTGNATTATTATNLAGGTAGQIPMQSAAGATTFVTPASANTAGALVKRDASGNFSAGTITANFVGGLSGNAITATTATNLSNGGIIAASSVTITSSGVGPVGYCEGATSFISTSTDTICIYSSPGTFSFMPSADMTAQVLMVGGGGGGGGYFTGGGGGGGGVVDSTFSLTANESYTIVVGTGGWGQLGVQGGARYGGGNSIFGSSIAYGGMYGGSGGGSGYAPGSGGGTGGGAGSTVDSSAGGTGTPGQGFSGGSYYDGSKYCAGGGGGADAAGANGSITSAGNGGIGRYSCITGTCIRYGGGGGGSAYNSGGCTVGTGGAGGGANGSFINGISGTDGLGGGGGGNDRGGDRAGGNGGSGVVIVRFTGRPGKGSPLLDVNYNGVGIGQSPTGSNMLEVKGATAIDGPLVVSGFVTAGGYTDGTPYPRKKEIAYAAVQSMERDNSGGIQHEKLTSFIARRIEEKSVNPETGKEESTFKIKRDISATISAHNEVLKDLIMRVSALEASLVDNQPPDVVTSTTTP